MTKFLNTDLDTTLGGLTPSDEKVSSQKAIKTYIDTRDATKVSKSGDSMTNNLEMTNGSIYLEGIGSDVASSTSRLNLGSPSNIYAYLTGNTQGAFGIYSEKSGSRKGIACYPNQNFFADASTKTIDLGRSNNVWKVGYIDTLSNGTDSISIANIINKVTQTSGIKKIYGTDASGNQTILSYSQSQNASYIVQRDANAQIAVPEIPVADENAASKKYVDTGLSYKANSADLAAVATTGDYSDLLNTPTYKTINSEIITGTGDISLQTKLSGTNGNVVTYTSTTGTLSELGFDNTPTQNSNKLVKSGPIWTELNKKVNITDIKNNLTSADTDKPLSAYQGKVLDEKITLAQQSTHDRGVVLNALTSQGQNYTITAATVNTAGTNYTIGDTLFLVSDSGIDAIINVLTVNSTTGAITSISLGQGGAFTTAPTSPSSEFVGGTGTGAKFTLTTNLVNNSTLYSIPNLQPNDFVTVLHDEIHNDLRYVWKYADIDGDGTYEWVVGYPITNIERNFQEQPIENTELATNAVTTVKIANNNITSEKIADNAIIARHITAGTITDSHIASGAAIDQNKIANLVEDLDSKVDKTTDAYQLYGTQASEVQTTITYSTSNTASTIAQRDNNGQISVAQTPSANTHATSKKYVDDQLSTKVDKVATAKRVYGTDNSGAQTTYDYDSFGKVDDVKVGTTSVLVNKIATLGTMAGESKDDYVKAKTTPIVAATKTKITYDADGLVTAGADLIESDIPSLHLSKITDVTATAAEVNVLDGISVSTTELNYTDGLTSNIQSQLNSKQETLVSGTNIKTFNNTSLLGSGNISITGLPSQTSQNGKFLTTNGTSASWVPLGTMATESKDDYVAANTSITGATKCKITYDSKGLVTAGANLQASDIPSLTLTKISDVTATATEVNYLSGVTSNVQTQLNSKAVDNAVVHTTGNETINGTKTFNDTLELKNNLSFRSYGSNNSGRLQFRAQPSDNIIRGTVAITDEYSTFGSDYNGFIAQMVARSGSTTSDPFNTMRVSNKGIEYIKEANDGTITGQYIIVDNNGLVPSDRLATSGTTGQLLTKTASGQAWQTFEALPSQTGNNGKYLTTNGTTASWVAIEEYTANEVETLWNSL